MRRPGFFAAVVFFPRPVANSAGTCYSESYDISRGFCCETKDPHHHAAAFRVRLCPDHPAGRGGAGAALRKPGRAQYPVSERAVHRVLRHMRDRAFRIRRVDAVFRLRSGGSAAADPARRAGVHVLRRTHRARRRAAHRSEGTHGAFRRDCVRAARRRCAHGASGADRHVRAGGRGSPPSATPGSI